MDNYFFSFLLYTVFANIFAGIFWILGKTGRIKTDWHPIEYPFIYLPWIVFVVIYSLFFGDLNALNAKPVMNAVLALQSVGAGVMGGLVCLPRILMKADSISRKIKITAISAVVLSIVSTFFRVILFLVVNAI